MSYFMNIDINAIMSELSKSKNPFFVSERHFQIAFALILKRMYKNFEVIPEYVFECKSDSKSYHVDLVTIDNTSKDMCAFEFKYVLNAGWTMINGAKYDFRNHSAADIRRAQFIYDIHRLENVLVEGKDRGFKRGYAIILTNMSRIYEEGTGKKNIDAQFDISKQTKMIKSGLHKFKKTSHKYKLDNVKLRSEYPIIWHNYKKSETAKEFKFLSIKVK